MVMEESCVPKRQKNSRYFISIIAGDRDKLYRDCLLVNTLNEVYCTSPRMLLTLFLPQLGYLQNSSTTLRKATDKYETHVPINVAHRRIENQNSRDDYMRIGVVEDDDQFRRYFSGLIKAEISDSEVFAWASPEKCLSEQNILRNLDVLVVDLHLPGMHGIQLIGEVSKIFPDLDCLILTNQADDSSIIRGLAAGAVGYIAKHELKSIAQAIIDVRQGKGAISPVVALRIAHHFRRIAGSGNARADLLTDRENEILNELSTGSSSAKAAEVLGISVETLRTHVKNIYKKYGVHNRVQLMQKLNDGGTEQ